MLGNTRSIGSITKAIMQMVKQLSLSLIRLTFLFRFGTTHAKQLIMCCLACKNPLLRTIILPNLHLFSRLELMAMATTFMSCVQLTKKSMFSILKRPSFNLMKDGTTLLLD